MHIYAIQAWGTSGAGVALVAAETEGEAIELARQGSQDGSWTCRYDRPEQIVVIPMSYGGEAQVISHYETGK